MKTAIGCHLIRPEDYQAMSEIISKFLYDESKIRPSAQDASDIQHLFTREKFVGYYVLEETDLETGKKKIIGGGGIQECQYPSSEKHPKTCELRRFYIDPEYRGAYRGKYFLTCLIDFAKEQGYQRILLETVPEKMQHAVLLYKKMGFFETKNQPAHCIDKTGSKGHLLMELTLNQSSNFLRSKL